MHRPTRKSIVLDLILCPSGLINTISVDDTFISDHGMISVETSMVESHENGANCQ